MLFGVVPFATAVGRTTNLVLIFREIEGAFKFEQTYRAGSSHLLRTKV
jgi:hypothetical protein